MSDALTDVRFWAQVLTDSKRTVACSPENESRCKGYVTARGLGGLITILVSPIVRDDQLIMDCAAWLRLASIACSSMTPFRFRPWRL